MDCQSLVTSTSAQRSRRSLVHFDSTSSPSPGIVYGRITLNPSWAVCPIKSWWTRPDAVPTSTGWLLSGSSSRDCFWPTLTGGANDWLWRGQSKGMVSRLSDIQTWTLELLQSFRVPNLFTEHICSSGITNHWEDAELPGAPGWSQEKC